ncbi:MAG: putative type IV restriction endonuclease [Myxococcota bacterium]|jgi:predicted type IV restriction endonuclease
MATSDPNLYVLRNHSYDRETVLWAADTGRWHRLKGPLSKEPDAQRKAREWAQNTPAD